MVDGGALFEDVDFPMLALNKFGWQQYIHLDHDEVAERCWRSDVIISAGTQIDQAVIDKAFKLKLIIAAGDNVDHIDLEAARKRDITVCNVPGMTPSKTRDDQKICEQVVDNINAFINGQPINRV